MNWRVFSTVLNCIGEEKVTLARQSFETTNLEAENQDVQSTSVDTPVQDVPTDAQVVQPVQVAQPEVEGTKDVPAEEQPMEVDQGNQCESGDLASSLAPSEEAVLLGSPSEDVRS